MKEDLYSTLKDLLEKGKEIYKGVTLSAVWSQYGTICFITQEKGKLKEIGFFGYENRTDDEIKNIVDEAVSKTNKESTIPSLEERTVRLGTTRHVLFTMPLLGKRKEDKWTKNKFEKALKVLSGNLMTVVVSLAVKKVEKIVGTYENHQITAGIARTKIAIKLLEETNFKVGIIEDKVMGTPTFLVKQK